MNNRLESFRSKVKRHRLDAALVANPANLRALTGRPVRLVPRKAPAKGVERIGYLCDPSFDLSVASVMRYFELRKDLAVEIRPVTRQDLDTGLGELLDRVINAKDE